MEYRKFGPTDLTVSVLGFGCHDTSRLTRNLWEEELQRSNELPAVNRAIDLGITCFDTAPQVMEGETPKRMLGRALGPRRRDVVVVTKCGTGL